MINGVGRKTMSGRPLRTCCSNSGRRGENKVLCQNGEADLDCKHGELIHSNGRVMDRWADVIVKACGSSPLIIYQYQYIRLHEYRFEWMFH